MNPTLTIFLLALPAIFSQMPPTKVEVAPVEERDVAPTIRLVGTVRPQLRSVVAAEVAGLVAELPAGEGDAVNKGAAVCKLRGDQRRFALDEARAQEAELGDVVAEARPSLNRGAWQNSTNRSAAPTRKITTPLLISPQRTGVTGKRCTLLRPKSREFRKWATIWRA